MFYTGDDITLEESAAALHNQVIASLQTNFFLFHSRSRSSSTQQVGIKSFPYQYILPPSLLLDHALNDCLSLAMHNYLSRPCKPVHKPFSSFLVRLSHHLSFLTTVSQFLFSTAGKFTSFRQHYMALAR